MLELDIVSFDAGKLNFDKYFLHFDARKKGMWRFILKNIPNLIVILYTRTASLNK